MKNYLFPPVLLLFLALFFNSCKKDETTDLVEENYLLKTFEIENSNQVRTTYFYYDEQERLDSFCIVDSFSHFDYVYGVNVEYPSDNKVVMTMTEIHFGFVSSTTELELTNGCVTKKSFFNHQFESTFTTLITCNENNQIQTKRKFDDDDNESFEYIEYEYIGDSLIINHLATSLDYLISRRKGHIVNLVNPFPTIYTYYNSSEDLGCFLKETLVLEYDFVINDQFFFEPILSSTQIHDQMYDVKRFNNTNWPSEIYYEMGQQGFSNYETHRFTYY